jgi:hypothetical protein
MKLKIVPKSNKKIKRTNKKLPQPNLNNNNKD